MTSSYSTNDVSRLARISPNRVRDYARAGLVGQTETPAVPQQRRYSFDFRDVMVLRMANELLERGIASARVQRVLRAVREQLPESLPLSGLRLVALDDRILVRSQGRTWEPESGQFILSFDVAEDEQIALELPDELPDEEDIESLLANVQEDDPIGAAEAWVQVGIAVEEDEPQKAFDAYLHAIASNPEHGEAYINLGRLCSTAGETQRAAAYFRVAKLLSPDQPVAHFNYAVTLHDLGRQDEAIDAYREAVKLDPHFADAHFNLAVLYEQRDERDLAVEHMATYREVSGDADLEK
ncbi:MAG: tetratricopeptide repeat protein [Myxococcota bacterium]|nr:tetratricopeptide repeat protein [Myxococcota bacterium]